MDLLWPGALLLVGAEWALLGWLSGVAWPDGAWWAPRWALRLLVGAVCVALAQLALAFTALGFSNVAIVLLVAVGIAGAIRLVASPSRSSSVELPRGWERVGWLLLGLLLLGATARALVVPEAGWDAYSHWGLKAQAYALAGAIGNTSTVHEDYPPLVPLLEAWLFSNRGAVSIDAAKTVWAIVGSAFCVCLAWQLRGLLRRCWLAPWVAVGITLGTTELLDGFWTGQADLALTAWLTLAVLAVVQWLRAPQRGWLLQAGLFSAAAALTKFEGLPRLAVLVLALAIEALLLYRHRRFARSTHTPPCPPAPCLRERGGDTDGEAVPFHPLPRRSGEGEGGWGFDQAQRPAADAAFRKGAPAAVEAAALAVVGVASGAAWLVWWGFRLLHALPGSAEHLSQLQPAALGGMLLALVAVFGGVRTGGILLVTALAWALGSRHVLAAPWRLLSLVVIGELLGTLLAFLVGETTPALEVETSATRLFEQFLPLALVASAAWLEHYL